MTNEERAHDVANMISHWQLEVINVRAKQDNKKVNVNLHSFYHKYYTELLNAFNNDPLFNK